MSKSTGWSMFCFFSPFSPNLVANCTLLIRIVHVSQGNTVTALSPRDTFFLLHAPVHQGHLLPSSCPRPSRTPVTVQQIQNTLLDVQ